MVIVGDGADGAAFILGVNGMVTVACHDSPNEEKAVTVTVPPVDALAGTDTTAAEHDGVPWSVQDEGILQEHVAPWFGRMSTMSEAFKPGSTAPGVACRSLVKMEHSPGRVHGSLQSMMLSLSMSVSGTPQPHTSGTSFIGSSGHASTQSGAPSPSVSVSANPQPQAPGTVFVASR